MPRLRLAVLDVDGTLKRAESPYQFLHSRLGVETLATRNRELAQSGQITYPEWLYRDVALWAGQPAQLITELLEDNPYLPGAPELLRALKRAGVIVALVSYGFTMNTDPIMAEFELDYVLANEVVVENGVLTGAAINYVDLGDKAAFTRRVMAEHNALPEETMVAGDTRGDAELFECAGLKVAVNPRWPPLRDLADLVCEPDLTGLVEWLVARGYLPGGE